MHVGDRRGWRRAARGALQHAGGTVDRGAELPWGMATIRDKMGHYLHESFTEATRARSPSAESCIRKAVVERGLTPGLVGLADAKAEDEAASRWADCPFAYGD